MTIKATNDFGTLIITANGDGYRIIEIDGITTDDKYIKYPVSIRENLDNPPSPVIGYKGRIGKLWDEKRDVFITKISYLEKKVEFPTIGKANESLGVLYIDFNEMTDATNFHNSFAYAWP